MYTILILTANIPPGTGKGSVPAGLITACWPGMSERDEALQNLESHLNEAPAPSSWDTPGSPTTGLEVSDCPDLRMVSMRRRVHGTNDKVALKCAEPPLAEALAPYRSWAVTAG